MSKVKIQSSIPSNFGQEVMFGQLVIKFDKLGFAEVESQEVAESLVSNYEGWLFLEQAPKHKVEDKEKDKQAIELAEEIERLKQKVIDREATIKASQEESDLWKNELEKYKQEATAAKEELEGFKIQTKKQIEELNLEVKLTTKTLKELIEISVQMEIEPEKTKDKNKQDLIKILLDESRTK